MPMISDERKQVCGGDGSGGHPVPITLDQSCHPRRRACGHFALFLYCRQFANQPDLRLLYSLESADLAGVNFVLQLYAGIS